MEKNKPTQTFNAGPVRAAIWENQTDAGGSFLSFSITRTYKDGDELKSSSSIGEDYVEDALYVLGRVKSFLEAR